MANAIHVPKGHLIMGLSLPLAVLLGYFVAEPLELGSMAVVVFVLLVLAVPLMLKWHYAFLVLSWHAAFTPAFLPGHPELWAMLAFVGLLFAVLNRAVSANSRFIIEPAVTTSLLFLTGVVLVTGMLTGGLGFQVLGSAQYGGRCYFYFLAAVAGYFVFTSRRIPLERAGSYLAVFFLSALTYGVTYLASVGGQRFDFLWWFFAPDTALREAAMETSPTFSPTVLHAYGLWLGGAGIWSYVLARHGIRGTLDLTHPWRLALLLAAVTAGLLSGFRSFVVLSALTFTILFILEGLHRTRYTPALLGIVLLGSVVVLPQADKLPLVAQRSLCFLPGKFDYMAKESAEASNVWRIEMWKRVWPEIPSFLFKGRGWGFAARDFATTVETGTAADPLAGTILVGNFHNGPLSLLIPFGLYGLVAFVWFLIAGLKLLHRNWKYGIQSLQRVNGFLFAAFAAQAIFFFLFFGSLYSDMAVFTGLLGFGVALNGSPAQATETERASTGMEFTTEYIRA